jgi:protocatechuate 3,4-dioxygenase beta subunit
VNEQDNLFNARHCFPKMTFMKTLTTLFTMLLLFNMLAACLNSSPAPTRFTAPTVPTQMVTLTSSPTTPTAITATAAVTCTPTIDDGLSPTYKPNTPIRSIVGHGYVLTGVVRSSRDCASIANAQLELWPEYLDQGHPDEARATILTDSAGRYRFECDPPEHIHMRISAAGYRTLAQNSYHPNGKAEGTFDIVLVPEAP